MASLENSKYCVTAASGMALSLILHSLPEGTKILSGDDVYGGTYRQFTTIFQHKHEFKFVDTSDLKSTKKVIEEFKPDFIWLETPTNPLLKISDISEIASDAKKIKAKLAVDNTFMTPYLQRQIDLGADIVLHSMTKYLNGHSDALGGAIMLNDKGFMEKLRYHQNSLGPSLSPFDSWLVLRGLKTLSVRMEQHQKNAKEIAKFLEGHSCVEFVIYPGLKSHPQYRIGKKQTSGTWRNDFILH